MYSGKHEFTKQVLTAFVGAAAGVVANKAVDDALTMGGYNPNVMAPLVLSDVVVIGAEVAGAFYAKKKGKFKASKFLVSMATGSVAMDVYKVAGSANWWGVLSAPPMAQRFGNGNGMSMGRYGKGNGGSVALYPTPTGTFYPRR